jgi:outer membrane protein
MGIIRRLATQDGYDIVVDKQAVPYVRSDLDLTDKIITMYNQGGGGTPDPKAGANDKRPGLPKGPTLKAPAKP